MNITKWLNNYKLIQWDDGSYGIRRGRLWYDFYDFNMTSRVSWRYNPVCDMLNCRAKRERAILTYKRLMCPYKVVEEKQ